MMPFPRLPHCAVFVAWAAVACSDPAAGATKPKAADAGSDTTAGKTAYVCKGIPGEDGSACDDDSACTFGDHCSAGQCVGEKLGLVYGGDKIDEARALVAMPDGGFAVAGRTDSKGAGAADMWLVRTDAKGKLVWDLAVGGTGYDQANALARTADGGLVMAGSRNAILNEDGADMALVKIDGNGKLVFDKTLGGTGNDVAYGIAVTAAGDLAMAGYVRSVGRSDDDADLVLTDKDGKLQWDQAYGQGKDERAQAVIALKDGFALAGFSSSVGAGEKDGWLVRTDDGGKRLWDQRFGSPADDSFEAIAPVPAGGFALAGYTKKDTKRKADLWLVRADATGKLLWEKTFGGDELDGALAVAALKDGGFVLAGDTAGTAKTSVSWLLRTNAAGAPVGEWTYGKADVGEYVSNAVVAMEDGGFALAGTIVWDNAKRFDMWLVRTDAQGKSSCE
ncbi:MAG: hypothetical protein EXR79_15540 [Myxococcales bacterium]|nr:hypothetical protein [Myxococcales bacterium]